jgi:diguanylate cyclase (GGDEF)-like protein
MSNGIPLTREPIPVFSKRWRPVAWAVFALLVAGWAALQSSPLEVGLRMALGDIVVYLFPMAIALVMSFYLLSVTLGRGGIEHRFWGLLCIATSLILIAESYWTWYTWAVDHRGPASTTPIILVLHIAAVLALFGVLMTMTNIVERSGLARLRQEMDIAIAMCALYPAVFWWVARPLIALRSHAGFRVAAIAAFYPVVGVALLGAVVAFMVGWGGYRPRSWERLVALSLAAYGVGLLASPLWSAANTVETGSASWYVVGLGFGYYLMVMAMVYRMTSTGIARVEAVTVPRRVVGSLSIVWDTFLVAMVPVAAWSALSVSAEQGGRVIVASAVVLAIALAVRSWVADLERIDNRQRSLADSVSGALSARSLNERLAAEVAEAKRSDRVLSLVVADIDGMSRVNVVGGREEGDRVLARVASRLATHPDGRQSVYRVGGDEFAIVLPEVNAADAEIFARRAWLGVRRGVEVSDGSSISLSIGIAVYPRDAESADALLAAARAATSAAARSDEDPIAVYDANVSAANPAERRGPGRSRRETVRALAIAVDARDLGTEHHSRNVSDLAGSFARYLGMSADDAESVAMASLVHDVGKVCVGDELLHKTDPLTPEDWGTIKGHPGLGEMIIASTGLNAVLPVVRSHHEAWDGSGYPDGLAGEEIPYLARIVSICDAFDAMTSERPYRPALDSRDALREIRKASGRRFDPLLAESFCRMMSSLLTVSGTTVSSRDSEVGV